MDPLNPLAPKPVPVENPLGVMQPGEAVLCEIKRHPFGIVSVFVGSSLFIVVLAVIAFVIVPLKITTESRSAVLTISAILFIIVALMSLGFMYVANRIYWGNRWILTTDSVTQCRQTSMLNREAKQLSLASIEDVTAEQRGVFAKIYNYGTLKLDTAKEKCEFMLTYCPDPMECAKSVLDAKEKFEQTAGKG